MANKLQLEGQEYATNNKYGRVLYFSRFVDECCYSLGEDDDGRKIHKIPRKSRYVKSEDILYEVKKIQQEQILSDGLLDEPEVSLSPANQTLLAEKLNQMARFLGCQFIIATHSPFMLGTLNARIYNLDSLELEEANWTELENVRYFYNFFEKHRDEFI